MSDPNTWDPQKTALLTIDLQNDFLHPEGRLWPRRAVSPMPSRPCPGSHRAAWRGRLQDRPGGHYFSAQFTLVPDRNGEPLIAPHLKQLRPFLTKGDFAPGRVWTHAGGCAYNPATFVIEKGRLFGVLPNPIGIPDARRGG